MRFKTIEDYNDYLNEMKEELKEIKEYLKEHPEKSGTQGNYETILYVYDIYKNNRLEFIQKINEINLKLEGNYLKTPLSIDNMYSLGNMFNETTNSTTSLLKVDHARNEELLIEEISKGSYNIKFSFQNPTEEDVKRTSPRKKGLVKLFDFIKCGDDIEKLKNEAGLDGEEALLSYKKFLKEIVKHDADFTLDTEKGTLKAGLTLQQCKNICENLKM